MLKGRGAGEKIGYRDGNGDGGKDVLTINIDFIPGRGEPVQQGQ